MLREPGVSWPFLVKLKPELKHPDAPSVYPKSLCPKPTARVKAVTRAGAAFDSSVPCSWFPLQRLDSKTRTCVAIGIPRKLVKEHHSDREKAHESIYDLGKTLNAAMQKPLWKEIEQKLAQL